MFDELVSEMTDEMRTFAQRFADAEHVRVALALGRQRRIAAANARLTRRRAEGLGALRQQYDSEVYHRLAMRHGGYQVINSRDFEKWLEKTAPEEFPRLSTAPDAVTVTVPAWKSEDGRRSEVRDQRSEVASDRPPTSDLRSPISDDRDKAEVSANLTPDRDVQEVSAAFKP